MTEQELMLLAQARRRRAAAQVAETAPEEVKKDPSLLQQWVDFTVRGLTRSPGKQVAATADAAANLVSSGVGTVAGGATGALWGAGAAAMGASGEESLQTASDTMENVADLWTYSPKTRGAQEGLNVVGGVMESGLQKLRDGTDWAEAKTGIPFLSPTLETAAQAIPEAFGVRKGVAARKQRIANTPDNSEAAQAAQRLGIDLTNTNIRDSVVESARTLTGDSSRATAGANEIPSALGRAEAASRRNVDAAFDVARGKDAAVDANTFVSLADDLETALLNRGADFTEGTKLAARMKDLRSLRDTMIGPAKGRNERVIPGQSRTILGPDGKPLVDAEVPVRVPLNELQILNERINGDITDAYASGRKSEARHLRRMKRGLEDSLDEQFLKDMIYGDKSAKDAWKDARLANRRHMERFSDDRTIKKLLDQKLTSKEVVGLVFGASEVNHRPQALRLIRKIKTIIGDDPEALASIRTAVFADVFDPLFQAEPKWSGTVERIRRLRRDDSALLAELGISDKDLKFMAQAAQVAKGVTTKELLMDKKQFASMFIARMGFGHDIAKAGLYTKTANMILDKMLGVGQKTHEQLLREFSLDPDAPVIKPNYPKLKGYLARAAAIAEAQGRGDNEDEEE
jgi:hypothetical protein